MHIFKFRISAALGILLLFALIAIIPSISLSEPSLSEPSLSKSEVTDLKRAKKSEIKKLQEHLRSKDFEIAKDGIYGDKTKEAILGNRKNGGSASAKDLGLTLAIQTILEKKPKSASKPDPAKDKDPKLPAPNPAKYKDSELPAQIEDPKTLVTDKIRHVDKNVNDISKKTKPPNTGENNKAPLKEVETINNNEPSFWEGIGSIAGFILTAAIAAVGFNVWFFKKIRLLVTKNG